MYKRLLRSKIHRARVTESNLEYEGSITISQDLLDQAKMVEYENVQVVNLNNGARFDTYIIAGESGSGIIGLNGPAARLGEVGDPVIIMSYGLVDESELQDWKPIVLLMDDQNKVKEILC